MLTKLIIENFKKINYAEIDLISAVVFVGPNNSGKTSALQAISLWDIGKRKWYEHLKTTKAKLRTAVTINRKELLTMPVPSALQIWKNLNVRKGTKKEDGKSGTANVRIKITAEGFTENQRWTLSFEFDYANPESIYCRAVAQDPETIQQSINLAMKEKIGFLPPMSGLSSEEDKLEIGSIQSRIGEGRTAEVLRNLCWNVYQRQNGEWKKLKDIIKKLFQVDLDEPAYDPITGKLYLTYREGNNKNLSLSNAGRGFQQILLLLSYMYGNDSTVLLLDEPDAHLEVIRQKDIYNMLTEAMKDQKSQLIIATHSEAVMNEAAEKDAIIGFIGTPHRVNKTDQLVKSLNSIGFDQYIIAEQKKWVLYLEGSTDLSMLKAFAKVLDHPVLHYLDGAEGAFVKTMDANRPTVAENHFYGLKDAIPDLRGFALFDHLTSQPISKNDLAMMMWERREIENYLPLPEVVERFMVQEYANDLFTHNYPAKMKQIIEDYIPGVAKRDKKDEWWLTTKMSDDFLDKIFREFYKQINSAVVMDKSRYYKLAELAKPVELNNEIKLKLDAILEVAKKYSI